MTTVEIIKEVKRKIKVLDDAIGHFPDVETWRRRKNGYTYVYNALIKINEIEEMDCKK